MDMKRILQAMDGVATKPVVGADSMARFLSIVDTNTNSQVLSESKTPHKVALPVQMAMQHYQKTETVPIKQSLGVSKYFHKVEEELAEQQAHKRQLINQYASTIAERVLMKEGNAVKQRLDPKCWAGKHKEGTKIKGVAEEFKGNVKDTQLKNIDPDNQSDGEGEFVKNQLHTIKRVITHLDNAIGRGEDLPDWVQSEIAQATDKIVGVMDYSISSKEQDIEKHHGGSSLMKEQGVAEVKQRLDAKCWAGKHKEGTKIKGGVRVNNCVPNESVNEHEAGWDRHGQGPGMQNYVVDEAPLDFDKDVPMSSTIYNHKGVNPASIESRIMRARGQLKELAKMAESSDPLAWQHISRLFPELAMNIEQIDHGLRQLGSIRRKGGRNSKNIPQHLDPDVNETVLNTIKPKTAMPKAIKPKIKTSTCRAGQTQTGMQIKDGKSVPKCSMTGIKK